MPRHKKIPPRLITLGDDFHVDPTKIIWIRRIWPLTHKGHRTGILCEGAPHEIHLVMSTKAVLNLYQRSRRAIRAKSKRTSRSK